MLTPSMDSFTTPPSPDATRSCSRIVPAATRWPFWPVKRERIRFNKTTFAFTESFFTLSFMQVVTVYLDKEKIEVYPASQKAKVNNMDLAISSPYHVKNSENQILASIRSTVDGFIEVDSPTHMITVTFDTKEIVVLISPLHRGRLCGMCGSHTGDKTTDLTGPRECTLPRDLMDVAYELNHPARCKSVNSANDYDMLRRVQEECLKEKSTNIFGLTDSQPLFPRFQQTISSSQYARGHSQWTMYRNKMIVRDNKRCFSTESVPQCKEGSRPADMEQKKVPSFFFASF